MSIDDMSLDELKKELKRSPLVVSQEYMDKLSLSPWKKIQAEAAIELGIMKIKEASS